MKAKNAAIAERREKVYTLWLASMPTFSIARQLNVPLRTAQRDIQVIRQELNKEQQAEMEERRARSIAVLRRTQQEAWRTFSKVQPNSVNAIGALNVIHQTEQSISKLEGVWGADIQVNQTTTIGIISQEEWQRIRMTITSALVEYPEARAAIADALLEPGSRSSESESESEST